MASPCGEAWSDNWDNWWDVMFVDIDLDGALDILGETRERILCQPCALMSRSVGLYRWNGAEMTEAPLETLAAGSVSDAAVTANNRAVELAGAGRWTEALAVLDDARAVVAESVVFRRNASLIDVNAPSPEGTPRRTPDTFLNFVLSGLWADAVDTFRHAPILPDFFADQPPYVEEFGGWGRLYWRVVFDAAETARRVAPVLPEIEFLRAWSAYRLDPESDGSVLEGLQRAVALAPNDPLFGEALRLVEERAVMAHTDAMRRTFLLFDTGVDSCAEVDCMEPRQRSEAFGDIGATSWLPWHEPDDTGRALADVPGGADLVRRFAAVYREDGESLEQVRAFPLSGSRFAGRAFWAVFDPAADTCRARRRGVEIPSNDCTVPLLAIYEHADGTWRDVTQIQVLLDVVSTVGPVDIEPSQAWIVARGVNERSMGANDPHWDIVRFDGEFLHVEDDGNWQDAMITDVDAEGALEILGSETFPLCYRCSVTRRVVRLYRWMGARMAAVPLEMLSAGAASAAAVAANNRAVELARARRWAEATKILDGARLLIAESAVFRRNASLIDLNAGASGGGRLSEDTLLHYVFAGEWADAVGLFRDIPVGPDLFAEAPPYMDASAPSRGLYGTPPFMRAIFDATAAARAVAPARPEVEFLHAWSAFHLDADTTVAPSTSRRDADYRIDVDESAMLEVFDRAAALAPGDPLFAEARRLAAERAAP